jgi:hypothetical protein
VTLKAIGPRSWYLITKLSGPEYYSVGLAVLGVAVGVAFRWQVLLPAIGLLPPVSIIFSICRGLGFLDTVIVIVLAEAVLQGGYFVGLLIRAVATRLHGHLRN